MNVGDFSTVFAAQTAAVRTRRADSERWEAEIATRRSEKRERAVELNSLAPIAESRKIADEKRRNEANRKNGNVEKTERGRENVDERRDARQIGRLDFAEIGARIDVFC